MCPYFQSFPTLELIANLPSQTPPSLHPPIF